VFTEVLTVAVVAVVAMAAVGAALPAATGRKTPR
jgi:hypothetical protein